MAVGELPQGEEGLVFADEADEAPGGDVVDDVFCGAAGLVCKVVCGDAVVAEGEVTLQGIAADYIARYTDIVTVSKDLHEGTVSNIVTVIRAELGCTLQNAVDTAAEIIRADADAFVDLRARLPHLGVGCHPDLESFLDRLQEWMANCEPWARNLPRYSKHYDEAG
ncbi:hypothetical protein [Streptomyces sp. NPDC008001]|uniref:terpene synthase family protein n=1 Tax=Streptomyces sp. NPDC008001 TaxID=3364804 RepID=UPI0036F0E2DC